MRTKREFLSFPHAAGPGRKAPAPRKVSRGCGATAEPAANFKAVKGRDAWADRQESLAEKWSFNLSSCPALQPAFFSRQPGRHMGAESLQLCQGISGNNWGRAGNLSCNLQWMLQQIFTED